MKQPFKAGDVVRLKRGALLMMVEFVSTAGDIDCVWLKAGEADKQHLGRFASEILVLATEDEQRRRSV